MKEKTLRVVQKLTGGNAARNVSFVLAVSVFANAASAELPAWATSMFSEVSTSVTDVLTVVGPVIGVSLVGFTIIRLIKRAARAI